MRIKLTREQIDEILNKDLSFASGDNFRERTPGAAPQTTDDFAVQSIQPTPLHYGGYSLRNSTPLREQAENDILNISTLDVLNQKSLKNDTINISNALKSLPDEHYSEIVTIILKHIIENLKVDKIESENLKTIIDLLK